MSSTASASRPAVSSELTKESLTFYMSKSAHIISVIVLALIIVALVVGVWSAYQILLH